MPYPHRNGAPAHSVAPPEKPLRRNRTPPAGTAPPAHWSGGYRCGCARSAYPESRSPAPAYPCGCRIPSAPRRCNGGRSPLPGAATVQWKPPCPQTAALPPSHALRPCPCGLGSGCPERWYLPNPAGQSLHPESAASLSGGTLPAGQCRFRLRPPRSLPKSPGYRQGSTHRLPGSKALLRSPAVCNRCRRWWQHENWISPPIPPAPHRQRFPPAQFR